MLTVHHLNNSRSQRVLWLLEELGTPYDLVKYERDPKTSLAPPELQKVHPLGKSPVVTDDTDVIAESGAILEYLVDQYGDGKFVPSKGSQDYLRCRYFMHYAEGSLMPFLLMRLITSRIKGGKMPFFAKPIARKIAGTLDANFVDPNIVRHVAFLDGELEKRRWFAGNDITVCDFQMLYPVEAIVARVPEASPRFAEWLSRVQERPAYKRALEKGGPQEIL